MDNETTDIQKVDAQPKEIQVVDKDAPLMVQIVQLLQTGKLDTDQMTAMLTFGERIEDNEARKAFHVAMAAFKSDPPEIFKNKTVTYGTGDNVTSYNHITLARLATILDEAFAKCDLSFTWKTEDLDKGLIKVTCILTHKLGHSETSSMTSLADGSGSKNPIQAKGSAVTYLQRYTLKSVAGVAEEDQDDDGNAAGKKTPKPKPITEVDEIQLDKLLAALPEKPGYVFNRSHIKAIFAVQNKQLSPKNITEAAEWLLHGYNDADIYQPIPINGDGSEVEGTFEAGNQEVDYGE